MASQEQIKPVTPPLPSSTATSTDTTSQLALILSKLAELDAIKQHLTTIDTRLNILQPHLSHDGSVAQRS